MRTFFTKTCCSLLRLLGVVAVGASVTACYGMPYDPACMYGTPTVDLDLAGQVLNENNEPIQGIDTSMYLFAKDVDGEENGKYQTDSLKIKNKLTQVKEGDGAWYVGEYKANDIEIKLKSSSE